MTDDTTTDDDGSAEDPAFEAGETDDRPDYNTGRQDAVSSGAKIRGKLKRGSATRDQDEIVIEGRGATASQAIEDFEAALSAAEDREWADRLRSIQPDGPEEDVDG